MGNIKELILKREADRIRTRLLVVAASLLALSATLPLAAQSPASVVLVRADRLLDPRTGKVLSPAEVLVENGKIKEVGAPSRVQADAPAGIKTVDLGNATLMPGACPPRTPAPPVTRVWCIKRANRSPPTVSPVIGSIEAITRP